MRSLAIGLLTFLLLGFESPLLQQAHVAHYAPDLVLVVVLYAGLTSRFSPGLLLAALLGLLKDGFAIGTPVGMYAEICVVAFLVAHRISKRVALRGPIGVLVLTAVFSLGASLAELLLALVFDRTFGQGASGPGTILTPMLPQALVTAPFGPFVFWFLDRLDAWTTRKRESIYL